MVSQNDIAAAHQRIAPHIRRTPVIEIESDAFGSHPPLSLKLEFMQHTGAFKARGALNSLLSRDIPKAGVAAASGGNHGAAVAFAAQMVGVPARIFVPEISSPAKLAKIRGYGADLVVEGPRYADALERCEAFVAETGALSIHAYDSAETVTGQGTVAREWTEQVSGLDTVLVAVGGGGLIAGVAAWFHDAAKVIGVEPEGACGLAAALSAGHPVDVEVHSVAADSLGARRVGKVPFEIAKQRVADVLTVPDADIIESQRRLWRVLRVAAEPGAAAAIAPIVSGAYRPKPDEKIGILICGGNVDAKVLSDVLEN